MRRSKHRIVYAVSMLLASSAISILFSLKRKCRSRKSECHQQAEQRENRALDRTQVAPLALSPALIRFEPNRCGTFAYPSAKNESKLNEWRRNDRNTLRRMWLKGLQPNAEVNTHRWMRSASWHTRSR
jgi:hypothetical protein